MYQYKAKILSVYDGDGVYDALVDMGMNLTQRKDLRLYGVDTPELRGYQKEAGVIVRNFVRKLILDKDVVIHTQKDKTGKYGRLLVSIFIQSVSLSDILISKGYAKPYHGEKKQVWTIAEIEKIVKGGNVEDNIITNQ